MDGAAAWLESETVNREMAIIKPGFMIFPPTGYRHVDKGVQLPGLLQMPIGLIRSSFLRREYRRFSTCMSRKHDHTIQDKPCPDPDSNSTGILM
jgi:hypothetical protein